LAVAEIPRVRDTAENPPISPSSRRHLWLAVIETFAVLASPAVGFFVLHLRPMAPTVLPDPAMHTSYIIDPRDIFMRYSAAYAPAARLRESARVGFLIPARLDFLAFGAVPGFFVTRYLFALVAVVPTYLLLRRLYCRSAGVIGILVILSCPVVITAWGTDYPDSAVVSYLIGALACLAMPCADRLRRMWFVLGSVLLTMAVWSHSEAIPLVIVTVLAYLIVRIMRARSHFVSDIALMAGVAIVVTGLLSVASGLELGQLNFMSQTWHAYEYLNTPAQKANWHTKGWSWATYLPYLLVPPAVVAAWFVVFARRLRSIPTPTLLIGLVCLSQVLVYGWLQFDGSVQTLEQHYFSSALWGSVCLTLALILSEVAKPYFKCGSGVTPWLPAALVLAVPLVYEASPREPSYTWWSIGVVLAIALVAGGLLARLVARASSSRVTILSSAAVAVVVIVACALYLTAVPGLRDPYLNQVGKDTPPAYSSALGGGAGDLIDVYRIAAELPAFVGNATYKNEQLLMWWPKSQIPTLGNVVGIYHDGYNSLPSAPPQLTIQGAAMLETRRPPELLLLNTSYAGPQRSLEALASYDPVLMRHTVLHSGNTSVYVWLINLEAFGPAR
jgi:hypothetical protein